MVVKRGFNQTVNVLVLISHLEVYMYGKVSGPGYVTIDMAEYKTRLDLHAIQEYPMRTKCRNSAFELPGND